MGMTLEEAIEHSEEMARLLIEEANRCDLDDRTEKFIARNSTKCAEERRQLAIWLRELQERRKQPEIIRCGECRYSNKKYSGEMFCEICNGFGIDENSFCSFAERRTDD